MPVPLITILLIIGLFFLFRGRAKRGTISVGIATILLIVFSFPMLPNTLLYSLERTYPQYDISTPVSKILILGCRHVNDRQLPVTAQLNPCSIVRATEAIRIFHKNPQATIITSGSVGVEPFSNAYMTKQFLVAMGIPQSNIIALEQSRDTEEEASNLVKLVQDEQFALVTSASHMKRAMTLFEIRNMKPIAAPTYHFVKESDSDDKGPIFPSADNLDKMERWWYEAMGNTWVWVKTR